MQNARVERTLLCENPGEGFYTEFSLLDDIPLQSDDTRFGQTREPFPLSKKSSLVTLYPHAVLLASYS